VKIRVVHGPNLNLLGEREPGIYGTTTLAEIDAALIARAAAAGVKLKTFQSNHEGELIDYLQRHRATTHAYLINPGGYTHTSVALRDCIAAIRVPTIEVHLSDVDNREDFRRLNLVRDVCVASFAGRGAASYDDALDHALRLAQS
jgi:3-dehydroquinate dehydratase-2